MMSVTRHAQCSTWPINGLQLSFVLFILHEYPNGFFFPPWLLYSDCSVPSSSDSFCGNGHNGFIYLYSTLQFLSKLSILFL